MDPKTQELVDQGADIPLDQILAGPYRSTLKFEDHPDGDVRGIGGMLRREGAPPEGPVVPHRGVATGHRKGWTGLSQGAYVAYQVASDGAAARELMVGKVLKNLANA